MSETSKDPEKTITRDESAEGRSSDSLDLRNLSGQPTQLGRYAITGTLGSGGFGHVFSAYDSELQREVAIKLPRRERYSSEKSLRRIAEEARMAARLQHPGIVTVFDVGTHNGVPYIVMEHIRGRSLAHMIRHESPSQSGTAQLIAEIASALAHAHEHGFVHRDIKPQNVLLDQDDRPHITDFGLAIRYRDITDQGDSVSGTTWFMAPEQVRGENHRIDERTDIWALGVMLYRMLTGKLPFDADDSAQAMRSILRGNPVPPRSIEPTIHVELERICMRCLSGQMSERYRLASDVADELLDWLGKYDDGDSVSGSARRVRKRSAVVDEPSIPVVPRGLRSFGQEDGDFFLSLVPGPRDRNGLPVSLSFWKRKIEERNGEETFSVGLLYGPSGCGKSSLVKAGLLPRLDQTVTPVYLDRMSRDMESRLLKGIRRRFPKLPRDLPLAESLRRLREDAGLREGRKLLIILDQFEQWLQSWHSDSDAELIRALLQCDGGGLQCVLMVRDDFWLPISRFMRKLEVGIIDGENSVLVDSFDLSHARMVLRKLGFAYHRLPEHAAEESESQTKFVKRAVEELADGNRLYPVRLAVFVEMVKDLEWVPESLIEMGGTEGVGIAFLEHSYGAYATPSRRIHQDAARNILAALLPPAGQIKRPTRTYGQLLEASGYRDRLDDFTQLLRVMDFELRLLTPTESGDALGESEGSLDSSDDHSTDDHLPSHDEEPSYQLTHDFLIPSVQTWLENQLRETPAGRARLLLKEQAELWSVRPTSKYLPSLYEWLTIRGRTNRAGWTSSQRKMMEVAGQRIARRTLAIGVILICITLTGFLAFNSIEKGRQQRYAGVLCSNLQDVEIADVPAVISEMDSYRQWTVPQLRTTADDPSASVRRRTRAALALLPVDESYRPWLVDQLVNPKLTVSEFFVIRDAIQDRPASVTEQLSAKLTDYNLSAQVRFRAACALASVSDSAEIWDPISEDVVNALIRVPAAESESWIKALWPRREYLVSPLEAKIKDLASIEPLRIAIPALIEFRGGNRSAAISLFPTPSDACYRACLELIRRDPEEVLPHIQQRLQKADYQSMGEKIDLIQAAFELGDLEPLREAAVFQPQSPELRANLIAALNPHRIDAGDLIPLILDSGVDDAVLSVALMATWQHLETDSLERLLREPLLTRLTAIYSNHDEAEIHSTAGLLMDTLGFDLSRLKESLASESADPQRDWMIDKTGYEMVTVNSDELPYQYAIGATEVRLNDVRRLFSNRVRPAEVQNNEEGAPVASITCYEIAGYCNRLSELNGIDPEQWCYPPVESLTTEKCFPVADFRQRSGYRIPTDKEWEIACRAGTETKRFFGESDLLMNFYGWTRQNAEGRTFPVAHRLPNPLGLFDMYGNLSEITIVNDEPEIFVTYGGSCRNAPGIIHSSMREPYDHRLLLSYKGFRLARTIPSTTTDGD